MKFLKSWWPALLVPVFFFRAYTAQFLNWDDNVLILQNPLLKLDFWNATKTGFSYFYHGDYFPVTLLSYCLDFNCFGLDPRFFHIENIFWHFLNVLVLLKLLRTLELKEGLVLAVGMIFAIHPMQAEPVMWLSERKSLISTFLLFLTIILYVRSAKSSDGRYIYALCLLAFLFSGLSKATGLLLPFLLFYFDFFLITGKKIKKWFRFIPMVLIAMLLVVIRVLAYSASLNFEISELFNTNYLFVIPIKALTAIGFYVSHYVLDYETSAIYSDFNWNLENLFISAMVFSFIGIYSFWIVKRKKIIEGFFLLWFLLFLIPVIQIFPRINYVNDRYMYVPIIGLSACCFSFLKQNFLFYLRNFLILVFGACLFFRTQVWQTNRNLWEATLQVVPQNVIALNNLGLDFQENGELNQAVQVYEKALATDSIDGTKILIYNNLANIYSDPKYWGRDLEKARNLLLAGIREAQKKHDTFELRINLGLLEKSQGNKEIARKIFKEVYDDINEEGDYNFQSLKSILIPEIE